MPRGQSWTQECVSLGTCCPWRLLQPLHVPMSEPKLQPPHGRCVKQGHMHLHIKLLTCTWEPSQASKSASTHIYPGQLSRAML